MAQVRRNEALNLPDRNRRRKKIHQKVEREISPAEFGDFRQHRLATGEVKRRQSPWTSKNLQKTGAIREKWLACMAPWIVLLN
jgi:hypothetical protein